MKTMTDLCIVYCTSDSRQNAEAIANQLLTQQLAACVQIIPGMTSVYRWDNQVMQ
ncbi:MAG TPA: divalent-cation tolerance protein CutA, partial [Alteromonas sp.]|nr:divalent-cation tolerance protein CutA [Alteromonas sp.]